MKIILPNDANETIIPVTEPKQTLGQHVLIELYDCPFAILSDEVLARHTIEIASRAIGAELLNMMVHRFEPHGLTALGLLSESHISIHTWPEHAFIAIDLFTCGNCKPMAGYPVFLQAYQPKYHHYQEIRRGVPHSLIDKYR